MEKICCICGFSKSLSSYYAYKRNKTGIMAACKFCHGKRTALANHKNMDKRRTHRREYNSLAVRRVANYENTKKMYKLYPEHQKARMKVYYAIKKSNLVKLPCTICGEKVVQAHHNDYSKPLDVVWYCIPHHKAFHSKKLAYV